MRLIILPLIFILSLFANPIDLAKTDHLNLISHSKLYIDHNSTKTIKDLKTDLQLFKTHDYQAFDLGFVNDSLWFYFEVENSANIPITKVLYIEQPIFDAIKLYNVTNDITEVKAPKQFKNLLNPHIEIIIEPQQKHLFIAKLSSQITPLNFSMVLTDYAKAYEYEIIDNAIVLLFLGSIMAFIIYNLVLSFLTKELAYLYYSLYFTTLLTYYAYYTNLYLYIYPYEIGYIGIYLLSLLTILVLLFSKALLNLKQYPKINMSFNLLIAILIVVMPFINEEFYPITAVVVFLLSALVYLIIVSIYLLTQKNLQAKYFIGGWSLAIIGYISFALENYALPNPIDYFEYFYESTIFLEAILFSMALASRLHTTKALENSVRQNKILTRELHHRVKNNMQFIISMYRLKLSSFLNDEMRVKLHEIENTIQAMSKTHEMLYSQKELSNLDTKEYINSLLEELTKSIDNDKIKIEYTISADLNVSQSIFCAIILTELITNSAKYAFDDDEGLITIGLSKQKNRYCLSYKDNGKGFRLKEDQQKGFGLLLIESLVLSDLKGELNIESKEGCKVEIKF